MSIDTRTESSLGSAAIRSAVRSRDVALPKSIKTTRWAFVRGKIMAAEFLAVAAAAFVASLGYYNFVMFSPLPVQQYILAALFIATLVSLVSIGFQHFSAIQMWPLHVLLWSGIGAVGLAFSLLVSTIFLLKIAEDYSRGMFFFQVICVAFAVDCGAGSFIFLASVCDRIGCDRSAPCCSDRRCETLCTIRQSTENQCYPKRRLVQTPLGSRCSVRG